MQIRVLGHVEASLDDRPLTLGGAKQRAVLAMLGLEAGHAVSADRLIEGLWGEDPPPSAAKMVQNYVWRLRGGGIAIITHGRAYELRRRPRPGGRLPARAAGRGRGARGGQRQLGPRRAGAVPRRPARRHRRRAVRDRRDPAARGASPDRRRAGDRRRPRDRPPPGAGRRDRRRCWPPTRCANGSTASGCSRSTAAGARRRRSRPTATHGTRWSRRSASSRRRSSAACTRRSCARIPRSTSSPPRPSCRASSTRRRCRR